MSTENLQEQLDEIQSARDDIQSTLESKGETVSSDIRTFATAVNNLGNINTVNGIGVDENRNAQLDASNINVDDTAETTQTIKAAIEALNTDIADTLTKTEAEPFINEVTFDNTTFTFTFKNYKGETQTFDLPLESTVKSGRYDSENKALVLVLQSDDEVSIPVNELCDVYTGVDGAKIKVTVNSNNEIEATIKEGTIAKTDLTTELQGELNEKVTADYVDTKVADNTNMVMSDVYEYVDPKFEDVYMNINANAEQISYVAEENRNEIFNINNSLDNVNENVVRLSTAVDTKASTEYVDTKVAENEELIFVVKGDMVGALEECDKYIDSKVYDIEVPRLMGGLLPTVTIPNGGTGYKVGEIVSYSMTDIVTGGKKTFWLTITEVDDSGAVLSVVPHILKNTSVNSDSSVENAATTYVTNYAGSGSGLTITSFVGGESFITWGTGGFKRLTGLEVLDGGAGYAVGDLVFNTSDGLGVVGKVTSVGEEGDIQNISIYVSATARIYPISSHYRTSGVYMSTNGSGSGASVRYILDATHITATLEDIYSKIPDNPADLVTMDMYSELYDKVDNIAVPEYSMAESTTTEGYAKTYSLTKDGTEVGVKINIPKDLVVNSGSVKEVTTANIPYTGAVVGDKYLDLVLNDSAEDHIYIPVKDLVDVYTGKTGTKVNVSINDANEISADIVTGSIEKTDLTSALQTEITNATNNIATLTASVGQNTDDCADNKAAIQSVEADLTAKIDAKASLEYVNDYAKVWFIDTEAMSGELTPEANPEAIAYFQQLTDFLVSADGGIGAKPVTPVIKYGWDAMDYATISYANWKSNRAGSYDIIVTTPINIKSGNDNTEDGLKYVGIYKGITVSYDRNMTVTGVSAEKEIELDLGYFKFYNEGTQVIFGNKQEYANTSTSYLWAGLLVAKFKTFGREVILVLKDNELAGYSDSSLIFYCSPSLELVDNYYTIKSIGYTNVTTETDSKLIRNVLKIHITDSDNVDYSEIIEEEVTMPTKKYVDDTVNTAVGTKAESSDLSALTTRVTTAEADIDTNTTNIAERVTKAEASKFVKGVAYDGTTCKITFTMYDNTTQVVDLPLESAVKSGRYDETKQALVLTLINDTEIEIPATDLIDVYTGANGNQIDVSVSSANVISAVLKADSVGESFLSPAIRTRLSTMESSISNNADNIDILGTRLTNTENTLSSRITTNNQNISTVSGRVTAAEEDIRTNSTDIASNTSDITALGNRLTTAENTLDTATTNIDSAFNRIGNAETRITSLDANKADKSELNTAIGDAINYTNEVNDNLQGQIDSKAPNETVETLISDMSNADQRVDELAMTIGDIESNKAEQSEVNALTGRVDSLDTLIYEKEPVQGSESHKNTYYFAWDAATRRYISNNHGQASTSAISTITLPSTGADSYNINWTVSSEFGFDKFYLEVGGNQVVESSYSAQKGTHTVAPGTTITITYSKDGSGDSLDDQATVQIIPVNREIKASTGYVMDSVSALNTKISNIKQAETFDGTVFGGWHMYSDGECLDDYGFDSSIYDKVKVGNIMTYPSSTTSGNSVTTVITSVESGYSYKDEGGRFYYKIFTTGAKTGAFEISQDSLSGGKWYKGLELDQTYSGGVACFTAGTKVAVEEGFKNIEDIQVGDKVYSYNMETKQIELKEVDKLVSHETDTIFEILAGTEKIETTWSHPFYTTNKGKCLASNLDFGDSLKTLDNRNPRVLDIAKVSKNATVYEIRVKDNYNYFVGDTSVLVFNEKSVIEDEEK